ncbi:hypothetical protein ACE02H_21590 [Shewanella mangrovisoli]|uniref:hypothetical protein n=1 Tax=Shewanella mangrovisoli TaxID=2864211 RepID=UPI0035B99249
MNNPLAGTDPTGYCSTGTHIKGKDVAGCSVVFDAGSGGSGKLKSEAKVTSNGGNNYTASFQLNKKTTLEVDFKVNDIGSQGAIASGSGVGGYSDDHLAKLGFAPGTRFFNDFGDPYLPPGMTYEQHHQAMENASEIAAIGLTLAIPGPEDILLGVYIASRGAELTAKAVGLARGADVVEGITRSAYEVAKSGGKHSGFFENNLVRSSEELQKGVSKLQKQIDTHEALIKDPEATMSKLGKGNWNSLDPRQQKALIDKKWPSDIQRQREQQNILQGILKEKG